MNSESLASRVNFAVKQAVSSMFVSMVGPI